MILWKITIKWNEMNHYQSNVMPCAFFVISIFTHWPGYQHPARSRFTILDWPSRSFQSTLSILKRFSWPNRIPCSVNMACGAKPVALWSVLLLFPIAKTEKLASSPGCCKCHYSWSKKKVNRLKNVIAFQENEWKQSFSFLFDDIFASDFNRNFNRSTCTFRQGLPHCGEPVLAFGRKCFQSNSTHRDSGFAKSLPCEVDHFTSHSKCPG